MITRDHTRCRGSHNRDGAARGIPPPPSQSISRFVFSFLWLSFFLLTFHFFLVLFCFLLSFAFLSLTLSLSLAFPRALSLSLSSSLALLVPYSLSLLLSSSHSHTRASVTYNTVCVQRGPNLSHEKDPRLWVSHRQLANVARTSERTVAGQSWWVVVALIQRRVEGAKGSPREGAMEHGTCGLDGSVAGGNASCAVKLQGARCSSCSTL